MKLAKLNCAKFAVSDSKFCEKPQQILPCTDRLDLHALLLEAGATQPRRERGRWDCPVCGKRGRVAVDLSRALFRCWTAGCTFHGSAHSLARRLGHKMDSPEWLERAAAVRRRYEVEERAHALRVQAYRAVAAEFREKGRAYDELRGARGQDIESLDRLLRLYADLLALNAQLILLDVLPPLEVCDFLGASEDRRQAQIRQVVSRDGLFVNGRFFDLPPVSSRHSVADVPGVPMPDGWIPGTAHLRPRNRLRPATRKGENPCDRDGAFL